MEEVEEEKKASYFIDGESEEGPNPSKLYVKDPDSGEEGDSEESEVEDEVKVKEETETEETEVEEEEVKAIQSAPYSSSSSSSSASSSSSTSCCGYTTYDVPVPIMSIEEQEVFLSNRSPPPSPPLSSLPTSPSPLYRMFGQVVPAAPLSPPRTDPYDPPGSPPVSPLTPSPSPSSHLYPVCPSPPMTPLRWYRAGSPPPLLSPISLSGPIPTEPDYSPTSPSFSATSPYYEYVGGVSPEY